MRESGGDAVAIERGIDGSGHDWDVHIAGEEGSEVAGGFLGLADEVVVVDLEDAGAGVGAEKTGLVAASRAAMESVSGRVIRKRGANI